MKTLAFMYFNMTACMMTALYFVAEERFPDYEPLSIIGALVFFMFFGGLMGVSMATEYFGNMLHEIRTEIDIQEEVVQDFIRELADNLQK